MLFSYISKKLFITHVIIVKTYVFIMSRYIIDTTKVSNIMILANQCQEYYNNYFMYII